MPLTVVRELFVPQWLNSWLTTDWSIKVNYRLDSIIDITAIDDIFEQQSEYIIQMKKELKSTRKLKDSEFFRMIGSFRSKAEQHLSMKASTIEETIKAKFKNLLDNNEIVSYLSPALYSACLIRLSLYIAQKCNLGNINISSLQNTTSDEMFSTAMNSLLNVIHLQKESLRKSLDTHLKDYKELEMQKPAFFAKQYNLRIEKLKNEISDNIYKMVVLDYYAVILQKVFSLYTTHYLPRIHQLGKRIGEILAIIQERISSTSPKQFIRSRFPSGLFFDENIEKTLIDQFTALLTAGNVISPWSSDTAKIIRDSLLDRDINTSRIIELLFDEPVRYLASNLSIPPGSLFEVVNLLEEDHLKIKRILFLFVVNYSPMIANQLQFMDSMNEMIEVMRSTAGRQVFPLDIATIGYDIQDYQDGIAPLWSLDSHDQKWVREINNSQERDSLLAHKFNSMENDSEHSFLPALCKTEEIIELWQQKYAYGLPVVIHIFPDELKLNEDIVDKISALQARKRLKFFNLCCLAHPVNMNNDGIFINRNRLQTLIKTKGPITLHDLSSDLPDSINDLVKYIQDGLRLNVRDFINSEAGQLPFRLVNNQIVLQGKIDGIQLSNSKGFVVIGSSLGFKLSIRLFQ